MRVEASTTNKKQAVQRLILAALAFMLVACGSGEKSPDNTEIPGTNDLTGEETTGPNDAAGGVTTGDQVPGSEETTAPPIYWSGPLNDTGIDKFADATGNDVPEPLDFPGQDAAAGRDASAKDDSDGRAGFHFVKLDAAGNPLADQNADYSQSPWDCVRDEVTGLTWEVKTTSDWRIGTNTYTWYDPDPYINGGDAGNDEGTHYVNCLAFGESDITCDTNAYESKVNSFTTSLQDATTVTGLCGYTDWRLPSRDELRSLIDYGVVNQGKKPKIDLNYFPNTQPAEYWTMHTQVESPDHAWEIHFGESEGSDIAGRSDAHSKSSSTIHVRLVRGGPVANIPGSSL